MQEWLNWTVSKTVVAQVTVGSNPTLSVFLLNDKVENITIANYLVLRHLGQ